MLPGVPLIPNHWPSCTWAFTVAIVSGLVRQLANFALSRPIPTPIVVVLSTVKSDALNASAIYA